MERLTEKIKNKHTGEVLAYRVKFRRDADAVQKLGRLEDLMEQGKLPKLPCTVGDTVYADSGVLGILEYKVDNIVIGEAITYQCSAYSNPIGDCPGECLDEIEPDISDFGKKIFLTPKEAEAALKELSEGKRND